MIKCNNIILLTFTLIASAITSLAQANYELDLPGYRMMSKGRCPNGACPRKPQIDVEGNICPNGQCGMHYFTKKVRNKGPKAVITPKESSEDSEDSEKNSENSSERD